MPGTRAGAYPASSWMWCVDAGLPEDHPVTVAAKAAAAGTLTTKAEVDGRLEGFRLIWTDCCASELA